MAHLEEQMIELPDEGVDIVVLPEMFTTGFVTKNQEKLAEPPGLFAYRWLKQMAAQHKAVFTGSVLVKENKKLYNRLLWVQPDGEIKTYDKKHLFSYAGEDEKITAGHQKLLINWKGWHIQPLICYDLRFPVWCRNAAADLMIFVANWPQARQEAWDTLLKARAIENLCYVAGANITGTGATTAEMYGGGSAVINYKGENIDRAAEAPVWLIATLYKKDLLDFRSHFSAHQDADNFEIKPQECPNKPD